MFLGTENILLAIFQCQQPTHGPENNNKNSTKQSENGEQHITDPDMYYAGRHESETMRSNISKRSNITNNGMPPSLRTILKDRASMKIEFAGLNGFTTAIESLLVLEVPGLPQRSSRSQRDEEERLLLGNGGSIAEPLPFQQFIQQQQPKERHIENISDSLPEKVPNEGKK